MTTEPLLFCEKCGKRVKYHLESSIETVEHNNTRFKYLETRATCAYCGNYLYSPELNDRNVRERHKSYYNALYGDQKLIGGNAYDRTVR